MSTKEVERFIADLKADSEMQAALKSEAAGVDTLIAFAKKRGYDISREDMKAHLSELTGQEVSDDQLDAIAGGAATTQTQTSTTEVTQVVIGPSPMIYGPSQIQTQVVVNSTAVVT